MPGPSATPLSLSAEDRQRLEAWTRRHKTSQSLAQRARIVLACAEPGATNSQVARALGVSHPTVALWRDRFAGQGPDGLLDAPGSGAPRTISDEAIDERLIALTLETTPGVQRIGRRPAWRPKLA